MNAVKIIDRVSYRTNDGRTLVASVAQDVKGAVITTDGRQIESARIIKRATCRF